MKKILISTGYGAGWSTWNSGMVGEYMLTYQPIIDFIEAGGEFKEIDVDSEKPHPLLHRLADECKEKFGKTYVCLLGAANLQVEIVTGAFKIEEYDGYESVEYRDEEDW